MKKFRNSICLVIALLLIALPLCGCGEKKDEIPEKVPNNIFSEFAYVKDGIILSRNVTYGQTIEAFKEERGITDEDILTSRDSVIVIPYAAEQFPYEIREAVYYKSDRSFESETDKHEILQVEYIIYFNKADAEQIFAEFYEQAKAVMPEPAAQDVVGFENTIENIKEGKAVYWEDAELNSFTFNVSTNVYGAEDMMGIHLMMRSGMYPTRAQQANQNRSE